MRLLYIVNSKYYYPHTIIRMHIHNKNIVLNIFMYVKFKSTMDLKYQCSTFTKLVLRDVLSKYVQYMCFKVCTVLNHVIKLEFGSASCSGQK